MKCATCGMAVKGRPIREEIEGTINYYCCFDCLEEELCRRDKPLRKRLGTRFRPTEEAGTSHAW